MNAAVARYLNALAAEVSIHRTMEQYQAKRDECRLKKKKFQEPGFFHCYNEVRRRREITEEAGRGFVAEREYYQLFGQDIP